MEDFSTLFSSRFTDASRSLLNTLAGVEDHAVRFRATLPTKGALVEALALACAEAETLAVRARQVQQALGLGVGDQKQAGAQTEAAQATALERIRRNEASLRGDLLVADETERLRIYALLYPTGTLAYYNRARLGSELADRLGQYLARTEAEATLLGNNFVQLVQQDLGPFRSVRQQQVAAQAATLDLRDDRHELVAEIDELCDHNYHLLSAHFRQQLSRVAAYWNPTYYLRPSSRNATGQVRNLAVQAHQHRQVFDLAQYPQFATILVSLRDGGPVGLACVEQATSPKPPLTLGVTLGEPLTIALAELPGTGTHLVAYNETGFVVHLDAQLS